VLTADRTEGRRKRVITVIVRLDPDAPAELTISSIKETS
jgi:hypothetical protein